MCYPLVLLIVLLAGMYGSAAVTQPTKCGPDGDVRFICGFSNPEDLVAVPRSDWVVVSGMDGGGVHVVSTISLKPAKVFPSSAALQRHDRQRFPSCPGPLDAARLDTFDAHGLAIHAGSGRTHTLYAVHHASRESIEVFDLDAAASPPVAAWIGCLVAPPSVVFNSVTPLPDGGLAATEFRKAGVPLGRRGTPTGVVWEWRSTSGWTTVPGSESEGPNGIEASPDGQWLYVNLWLARKVMRLSRGRTPVVTEFLDLSFGPDNLRMQADGTLLAAGHGGPNVERVRECVRKLCDDVTSNVARIDPVAWRAEHLITYPFNEHFLSATAALQVGHEIWIGALVGDRLARYPLR